MPASHAGIRATACFLSPPRPLPVVPRASTTLASSTPCVLAPARRSPAPKRALPVRTPPAHRKPATAIPLDRRVNNPPRARQRGGRRGESNPRISRFPARQSSSAHPSEAPVTARDQPSQNPHRIAIPLERQVRGVASGNGHDFPVVLAHKRKRPRTLSRTHHEPRLRTIVTSSNTAPNALIQGWRASSPATPLKNSSSDSWPGSRSVTGEGVPWRSRNLARWPDAPG